ncbi:MAG TPA: sigma-70 family RNA polymerase sigma factor [Denitromonas sp.]|uniref:sigma-70 family RNA polymerase sigma factor n=1 Tax=Denitromonas sp. TaxID=2734609 RepID=UPI001D3A044E|nr:sigma-70 family RNA polymerase sigma factor [Rhodocyclaceae bacterium]MCP5221784.1 sigma-70 family RNA polymerase sigma factor [Zoogloeaceae bacterium]HQU89942.1 sigma-70 family RNA polymerase sigma factor [Denitromonas sp.]HQV15820.1 sigma-70 family RNA polymerase sigma factor [Denitromonas sp.]
MLLSLGKRRAFDQVVRAYSSDLYRFAYWLCGDRFVAEDVVQEAFVRAWQRWDQLRDKATPKPWLLTIVRREHARLYERKRFDYVDDAPEDLAIAADHDPLEMFELEQVIGNLPLSLREPFLLQTLGGFSCAEIAEQLETTEGAIMVRLTRARQALRGLMGEADRPRKRGSQ